MISLIQLPYRRLQSSSRPSEVGSRATALVLALILIFQIGLLVWVFLNNWQ